MFSGSLPLELARDYTFAMQRSVFSVMRLLSLLVAVLASTPGVPRPQRQPPPAPTIFGPDPNHLWNRTYACVFIRQTAEGRQYGADTLDPLLWWQTRYLLSGQSHRRALRCLDEFLRAHAEHLVADPLKHAILQHDLWAVFDWAAAGEVFLNNVAIWKFGWPQQFIAWPSLWNKRTVCRTPTLPPLLPGNSQPRTIRATRNGRFYLPICSNQAVPGFVSALNWTSPPRSYTFRGDPDSSYSCDSQVDAPRRSRTFAISGPHTSRHCSSATRALAS